MSSRRKLVAGVVFCPACAASSRVVRHGNLADGSQRYRCRSCGRTFQLRVQRRGPGGDRADRRKGPLWQRHPRPGPGAARFDQSGRGAPEKSTARAPAPRTRTCATPVLPAAERRAYGAPTSQPRGRQGQRTRAGSPFRRHRWPAHSRSVPPLTPRLRQVVATAGRAPWCTDAW